MHQCVNMVRRMWCYLEKGIDIVTWKRRVKEECMRVKFRMLDTLC